MCKLLFLSTLSLRRATRYSERRTAGNRNFYPRSPCGERPLKLCQFEVVVVISIHALLAESDRYSERRTAGNRNFYPRSPCGERRDFGASRPKNNQISIHALLAESDPAAMEYYPAVSISIHALLAESDDTLVKLINDPAHFYPRSPCGERRGTGGADADTW